MTQPDFATLVRPGPVWGLAPERRTPRRAPRFERSPARRAVQAVAAARRLPAWPAHGSPAFAEALAVLRAALRREGFQGEPLARALAVAAQGAEQALGWQPYDVQLQAAALLLDGRLAEMATGEGKTLAVALAAVVAALAGVPVHVVTANDYLAGRDADAMQPLYAWFGLRGAALAPVAQLDGGARQAAYAADVLHASAKELAFDALRDEVAVGGRRHELARRAARLAARLDGTGAMAAAPAGPARHIETEAGPGAGLQRGWSLAIVDEADSVLIDEATLPLLLSRPAPDAARRARHVQALALARRLEAGRHWHDDPAPWPGRAPAPLLTPEGRRELAALAAPLGPRWQRPQAREATAQAALLALHGLQRDRDYLVRGGAVELLDAITGRAAPGRVWSRGLQALVEIKEGVGVSAETETLAQTSFQRYFARYGHLCGLSGTLREARAELRRVYGLTVVPVPLHRPCRRVVGPLRGFADEAARRAAVVRRAAGLQAAGRPVLVGTDSVEAAGLLAQALAQAGVAHRVLDARHDADEAAVVAEAGRAGRVTVATRMAGRGTDIQLDEAARAAGGLHVIVCQRNPSRRLDRQLVGRAARHGDPGSCETWVTLDRPPLKPAGAAPISRHAVPAPVRWPGWLLWIVSAWPQWRDARRLAAVRRELLETDQEWERRLPPAC